MVYVYMHVSCLSNIIQPEINVMFINACDAELLLFFFHSFEAGIADAISNLNDDKYIYTFLNKHV